MNSRPKLANMLFSSALLAVPGLLSAAEPAARPPNVILLMADDLGWGDVGFNGNTIIKTPQLDAMAQNSVRFSQFFAGGPVCSPTRGTCLTGRHYCRYGITDANAGHLPREEVTLAELCQAQGYVTGHFGKWHLGTLTRSERDGRRGGLPPFARDYSPPWEHGFAECFSTEVQMPTWDPMRNQAVPGKYWVGPGQAATGDLAGDDSRVIMDRVEPFIRRAAGMPKPFLAVVWFHTPHEPVRAGPEYRARYAQYSEGEQHYYGSITAMDEQVGRLRQLLRELNIADNTMLWFTSDNGPEGRDGARGTTRGSTGGLRGRKRSLFSGGVMVPSLLEWPARVAAGRTVSMPCSTLDYFPTVMAALPCNWPGTPRPLDGISLLPAISGEMSQRPAPICFRYDSTRDAMFGSPTLAMVEGNCKFLTNLSADGSEDALFDLAHDRTEEKNLVGERAGMAADMKRRLKEWFDSCRASHNGADYDAPYRPDREFVAVTGDWRLPPKPAPVGKAKPAVPAAASD